MTSDQAESTRVARSAVLAAIDHPLALAFIATLGVLGGLVIGLALGSISTILVYIVLAMFVAPRVWWRLLTSRKDVEHAEVEEVSVGVEGPSGAAGSGRA